MICFCVRSRFTFKGSAFLRLNIVYYVKKLDGRTFEHLHIQVVNNFLFFYCFSASPFPHESINLVHSFSTDDRNRGWKNCINSVCDPFCHSIFLRNSSVAMAEITFHWNCGVEGTEKKVSPTKWTGVARLFSALFLLINLFVWCCANNPISERATAQKKWNGFSYFVWFEFNETIIWFFIYYYQKIIISNRWTDIDFFTRFLFGSGTKIYAIRWSCCFRFLRKYFHLKFLRDCFDYYLRKKKSKAKKEHFFQPFAWSSASSHEIRYGICEEYKYSIWF